LTPVSQHPASAPVPAGIGRRYGEQTAQKIDEAVRELVEKAFGNAVALLREKRAILDRAAAELLAKETLSGHDLARLIGETPTTGLAAAVAG
jgi:cell division protease FtsH